jgi:hypothetical protein
MPSGGNSSGNGGIVDPLSFIAKFIGVPARVGAVIAVAALAIYGLRRAGFEPFASMEPTIYQTVAVAGVIGAAMVATAILLALREPVESSWSKWRKHRINKEHAQKNMELLTPQYADALRYAKANNLKRFAANPRHPLVNAMCDANLIEIDDPNYSYNATLSYFVVPKHVWKAIDKIEPGLKAGPIPRSAPWEQASGQTWMSR